MPLIIVALALFGNTIQLQLKYDFCEEQLKSQDAIVLEHCKIQHKLYNEFKK